MVKPKKKVYRPKGKFDIVGWTMVLLNTSIVCSTTYPIIVLSLNFDPFFPYLPRINCFLYKVVLIAFRFLSFQFVTYLNWQLLIAMTLTTVHSLNIGLAVMRKVADVNYPWKNMSIRKVSAQLLKKIRLHTTLRYLLTVGNEAYFFFSPVALLLTSSILILCNFAIVRMHSVFSIQLYVAILLISILISGAVAVVCPVTANIHEVSEQFLRTARFTAKTKLEKRIVAAERSLKIEFGSLFYATRYTKTTLFSLVIDYTINSLLSTSGNVV
jgi:hypothetical protein